MKRITITIIVLVTVCCLLVGCTPNEENSAETYTLPALETGEQAERPDPSAPEVPGTPPASEPGGTNPGTAPASEPGSVETAPATPPATTAPNSPSGSPNPDVPSTANGPEDVDPGNTDQPPAGTTDAPEVHTVNDSEENLTPRDSDPIHEEYDSSEDIPMTETPVQAPIDTEDPDMIVESDYVYEPSGNVGIGGN